jgi:hypothetical protein
MTLLEARVWLESHVSVVQICYSLAAVSILLLGFGLLKSRKGNRHANRLHRKRGK